MEQDYPSPVALTEPPSAKRSSSPSSVPTKKVRGERISSKDFVPPDVSGMSKREARLVKNRAAAFLSRQRKREEFETMEIRVGELEEENARLLALAQSANPTNNQPATADSASSEVEKLKAQLAAAQERERELCAQIAATSTAAPALVKSEASELLLPPLPSPPRSIFPSASSAIKSGTGLGLMVLLCALPNLLSIPTSNSMPTSFSSTFDSALPMSPSPGFDINSFIAQDHDWSRGSIMDLDIDGQFPSDTSRAIPQKLHLSQLPSSLQALNSLQGLDISFDAVPGEDGKITVRIHPPAHSTSSAPSSRASSVPVDTASSPSASWVDQSYADLATASYAANPYARSSSPHASGDPFLGVGDMENIDYGFGSFEYGSPMNNGPDTEDLTSVFEHGSDNGSIDSFGSSFTQPPHKRRVRVTLKSMPVAGGEGGEWEVQFC
jgi:hypothetical protein